jgi:hypothetical protein
MVRYFRSSFPGQFITIGMIGIVLWGLGVIHLPQMPPPEGPVPLYELLYSWLSGFPYVAISIGFILVIIQAVWINYIVSQHDLVPHNTSLAALLFLLFISLLPSYLTLTPVNISTIFLLFILRAILAAYNQPDPIELIYTAGFFVALSSFFYLPSLLFYGFLLIFFIVYRSLKWREWVSSLIGLATPLLYLVVIYFLTDRLDDLFSMYSEFFKQYKLFIPSIAWNEWVQFGILSLLLLLGLWDTFRYIGDKTVELRKKTIVLLWMLIWILITIFYSNSVTLFHPGLLSIPLAVFVTNFFMHLRKPKYFEFLLWVLLLSLILNTLVPPYILIT